MILLAFSTHGRQCAARPKDAPARISLARRPPCVKAVHIGLWGRAHFPLKVRHTIGKFFGRCPVLCYVTKRCLSSQIMPPKHYLKKGPSTDLGACQESDTSHIRKARQLRPAPDPGYRQDSPARQIAAERPVHNVGSRDSYQNFRRRSSQGRIVVRTVPSQEPRCVTEGHILLYSDAWAPISRILEYFADCLEP